MLYILYCILYIVYCILYTVYCILYIVYCILSRYNYPHHDVPQEVWWYYMVELSFYWSLSFSQFFDVKRKDFVEMFIHHVTTIALLCFSWTCNLFRYISTLATLKGLFTYFKIDIKP